MRLWEGVLISAVKLARNEALGFSDPGVRNIVGMSGRVCKNHCFPPSEVGGSAMGLSVTDA